MLRSRLELPEQPFAALEEIRPRPPRRGRDRDGRLGEGPVHGGERRAGIATAMLVVLGELAVRDPAAAFRTVETFSKGSL
jgi:hypothetical protein